MRPHRETRMPFLKERAASGWEISFLVFAVALLAVPSTSWIMSVSGLRRDFEPLVSRALMFGLPIVAIVAIRPLRRAAANLLRTPIPRECRLEVLGASLLCIVGNFASAGAIALWIWLYGGDALMVSKVASNSAPALASSLSTASLLFV